MLETQQIVDLWKRTRERGETVYLATVVHVKGSSYRKPGARMLVTSGGQRAGTISGGCLEAEVSRKIAWMTRESSVVVSYQSSFDDDVEGVPYGLGCGGTIWILMETGPSATAVLNALEQTIEKREPSVLVTSLREGACGTTRIFDHAALSTQNTWGADDGSCPDFSSGADSLLAAARRALQDEKPIGYGIASSDELPAFLLTPVLPPPRMTIFGAGDDAKPIVAFASKLGWHITVADGRSHLLRSERFPEANGLLLLAYEKPLIDGPFDSHLQHELVSATGVRPGDIAVILTHSYEQDRALLKALLVEPLRYLGILGPRHRTARLVASVADSIGLTPEECMARLHAPVGLNIGSGEPPVIAIAIIAEIQAELSNRTVQVTPKNFRVPVTSFSGALDPFPFAESIV